MPLRNGEHGYGAATKALHWLTFGLILGQFVVGYSMGRESSAADAAAGARRFEEAVPLYRAALQQPGVDRVAVGTRLGAALALAGRRTEAEAAFRGVAASGDSAAAARWYADLARFWLAWLARSG